MKIVESIADWYEDSGWRVLRTIALVLTYIMMFGGMVGLVILGIYMSKLLDSFGYVVLFILAAAVNFFACAFACGVIKGDINLISQLKYKSSRALKKSNDLEKKLDSMTTNE